MGELPNRRHELFCLEVAAGTPLREAFIRAGFKPGRGYDCRHNASRLHNRPSIKKRLAELRERGNQLAEVGIGWVQRKLIGLADGSEAARIKVIAGKDGDVERIEEIDRLSALLALAKTLGVGDSAVTVNAVAAAQAIAAEPKAMSDAHRLAAISNFIERVRSENGEALGAIAENLEPKPMVDVASRDAPRDVDHGPLSEDDDEWTGLDAHQG